MVYFRSLNRNPDRERKSHRKCNSELLPNRQYAVGSLNLQKWYPFSGTELSDELASDLIAEMEKKKLDIL